MLLTAGHSSLRASAQKPAVAIAKGESLWAPSQSRAYREDGLKSQVLLSLSLGTFGHLATVAHAQLCVACTEGKGPLGWVTSHHNVDEESWD